MDLIFIHSLAVGVGGSPPAWGHLRKPWTPPVVWLLHWGDKVGENVKQDEDEYFPNELIDKEIKEFDAIAKIDVKFQELPSRVKKILNSVPILSTQWVRLIFQRVIGCIFVMV